MRRIPLTLVLVAACGAPRPAPVGPSGLRAQQLVRHYELIGHIVSVDVYEPMHHRDPGEHSIDIKGELVVVAARDAEERAAGGLSKLPERIDPPVQIRGMLKRDRESWRLIAHDIKPVAATKPERVASVAALAADPKWNGRFVVVEGMLQTGFESAWLDDTLWVDISRNATVRCAPPESHDEESAVPEDRVRVAGLAYRDLGQGNARMVVNEVVYLGRGCD
jgi:hypothetical protein